MLDTLWTKKVDQFTKLPMDQTTIAHVTSIADNDRRKVRSDPGFRRGYTVISFEEGDADITNQMLELNIRNDTHLIQPTHHRDHFPLDAQGQANYLESHVGSSRRSDVVVVDKLVTATAGENESEPPPPPPISTVTTIDILQPSQVVSSTTDNPSDSIDIIDLPPDDAITEQQDSISEQEPAEKVASDTDHQEHDLMDLYDPKLCYVACRSRQSQPRTDAQDYYTSKMYLKEKFP